MRRLRFLEKPDLGRKFNESFRPPDGNLQEKMIYMESFHKLHPEYPVLAISKAAGVSNTTFYNFLHRNKRGDTKTEFKRRSALELLKEIHPDKSAPINIAQTRRILNALGISLGYLTLRSLLLKNDFKTLKVNQNC